MKNTIQQINECIRSYNEYYKSLDINSLLDLQTKLSTLSYYLAQLVGQYRKEYNDLHVDRKNKVAIYVARGEGSIASLEHKARVEYSELISREYKADGKYEGYKLILNQTNTILSALSQRISWLKQEYNLTNKGD